MWGQMGRGQEGGQGEGQLKGRKGGKGKETLKGRKEREAEGQLFLEALTQSRKARNPAGVTAR